jgi:penicillin-binding protein 1A
MLTRASLKAIGRLFRYLIAGLVLFSLAGMGFLGGTYVEVRKSLPDLEDIAAYRPRLTTQIFSTEVFPGGREEHTLLGRVYKEDREPEELRNMPVALRQATIAIEDTAFYKHRGVDPRGILRAAFVNLRRGSVRQGGSTITQQLARNMWLSQERTMSRKLKEMLLAAELERRFSKDEILEMYLNEVFYGHGTYGVKRAATLFFGKPAKDLTLAQCALLAGLPKSPIAYSPYAFPDRARARRHQVLRAMREEGFITQEQFKQADAEQLQSKLAPLRERGFTAFRAPYFTHYVVRTLCDRYGVNTIYEGGLQVYTTLDIRVEEAAEHELTKGVEQLRRDHSIKGGLVGQGALACVDVHTGNVLAMVGGVGPYEQTQFNRTQPGPPTNGRQPGSSFKPYIWAAALEQGYGPDSTFSGDPISIPLGTGEDYTPKNYTPGQGGSYTLRNALAQSVNLVSVRVVQRLGIEPVRRLACTMLNIPEARIRPFWSLALGANELSPLEQATGYCVFASGGIRPTANFVRRITDYRGQEVISFRPELVRVIRAETANSMISMMRGVVTNGTGRRAAISGYAVAGKTGTTNSGRDVWWVGYTPDLSAAVWVGNDDNDPMPEGSGGGFCAPIWARFMKRAMDALQLRGEFPEGAGVKATRSDEAGDPTDPPGRHITVCVQSGQLATPYCPATTERTLKPGEAMPGRCRMHGPGRLTDDTQPASAPAPSHPAPSAHAPDSGGEVTVTICTRSGLRAGPNCPQTTERTYRAGRAPAAVCHTCGRPNREETYP